MVSADHGPAVSGAHNTIVTARAGKDLVSSLTSGLLTIVSKETPTEVCHLVCHLITRGTDLVGHWMVLPSSSRRHTNLD